MSEDITKRLLKLRTGCPSKHCQRSSFEEAPLVCVEAAKDIRRLRRDNGKLFRERRAWRNEALRLQTALERIAYGQYHWEADAQEEARAALEVNR